MRLLLSRYSAEREAPYQVTSHGEGDEVQGGPRPGRADDLVREHAGPVGEAGVLTLACVSSKYRLAVFIACSGVFRPVSTLETSQYLAVSHSFHDWIRDGNGDARRL